MFNNLITYFTSEIFATVITGKQGFSKFMNCYDMSFEGAICDGGMTSHIDHMEKVLTRKNRRWVLIPLLVALFNGIIQGFLSTRLYM